MSGAGAGPWTLRLARLELRVPLLPTAVTLVFLALLVSLGQWQLDRAGQKEALAGSFDARSRDHTVRLEASLQDGETLHFQRVEAHGRYAPERQFLLDNRTHRGVAGYHVLTPLRLDAAASVVLVNRGWIPVGPSRAVLPDLRVAAAPRVVTGIATVPGPGALLLGPDGYESGGWPRVVQRIDLDAMSRLLGEPVLPYTVRLDPERPDGYLRDWRAFYGIGPERHRAYAFQWFSLAAALLVIYLAVNLRRAPRE